MPLTATINWLSHLLARKNLLFKARMQSSGLTLWYPLALPTARLRSWISFMTLTANRNRLVAIVALTSMKTLTLASLWTTLWATERTYWHPFCTWNVSWEFAWRTICPWASRKVASFQNDLNLLEMMLVPKGTSLLSLNILFFGRGQSQRLSVMSPNSLVLHNFCRKCCCH